VIEYRAAPGDLEAAGNKLGGYAARFNSPAALGDFEEVIAKGAFRTSLRSKVPVPLLVGHDQARAVARTPRTLRLVEDGDGLAFEADLPDTQEARDLRTLISEGVLDGMSFGFQTVKEKWEGARRTLQEVRLLEVSVVAVPAYADTTVALRSRPACTDPLWVRRRRLFLFEHERLNA